jgi:hypothetical protein
MDLCRRPPMTEVQIRDRSFRSLSVLKGIGLQIRWLHD